MFNFDKITSSNVICYFQNHCRQNYNKFYFLFKLLKSIEAIERERRKLEIKLENLIGNGECEHQKLSRNDFNEICQLYSSRKELFCLFI